MSVQQYIKLFVQGVALKKCINDISFESVVFDLDGVITKTDKIHAQSWKLMFDAYFQERQIYKGDKLKKFNYTEDYLPFIDGKPRYQGVKSLLEAYHIHIPFGDKNDTGEQQTICGLGNKKNDKFREVIKNEGVEIYSSTMKIIENLYALDIPMGVASSSKNCQFVLETLSQKKFFLTCIDGLILEKLGLRGKPSPEIFIKAVNDMGCKPSSSIVVEDAISGVEAGKAGGFGLVIGLARENNEEELRRRGADVVIRGFEGIGVENIDLWFREKNG